MLLYQTIGVKVSGRHPFIDVVPLASGVCDSLKVQMLFPHLRRKQTVAVLAAAGNKSFSGSVTQL